MSDKDLFKKRVREWANKIDVPVQVISIRRMRNKWASFSSKSSLFIFDEELLSMEKDVIDYVIVHELLHYRVPNHGKLWKSMMMAYLGDYTEIERSIKKMR